jgi:putative DNA primase/helicase
VTYDLLQAACDFADADCCVIPAKSDGTKAPATTWRQYQVELPAVEQLASWFSNGSYDGFGIVCGSVSGGLEMLEFEGRAIDRVGRFGQLLTDNNHAELWDRVRGGYVEQTPSGGLHFLYRVIDAPAKPNTKLARRPSTDAELADWKARQQLGVDAEPEPLTKQKRQEALDRIVDGAQLPQVLVETRGEGGFVVVAPSGGRTHETGAGWVLLRGGPTSIANITAEERDLLYWCAEQLDEMPEQIAYDPPHRTSAPDTVGPAGSSDIEPAELRPGDDFERRATWEEILEPHGWTKTRANFAGPGSAWTRPGKDQGVSATTGTAETGDRFYVFSSSTTFESERPYSKFATYAELEHGGDMAAAASELRHQGYGGPPAAPSDRLTWQGKPGEGNSTLPTPPPGVEGPPGEGPPLPPQQGAAASVYPYQLADDGNALNLVDRFGTEIRFCPQRKMWLRWDGSRWKWDDAEHVRELARTVARDLPRSNPDQRRWAIKSLDNSRISAMVSLAKTDNRVTVDMMRLDAHPYELNTPGGIADLRTGQIIAPDPDRLHTRSTSVVPDFQLAAPRFERFLAETFAGDPEMTTYVQRLLGVTLLGEVREQILPFAYGVAGNNGKTTLLTTVQRLIGMGEGGYSISAPAEVLLQTKNTDHPATIAQFSGARLVVTSELEEGQRFAEQKVKLLTGADAINARFMAKNPFTFLPTHTLWLLANSQPDVRAGGTAFWRRIRMLPFLHRVPDDEVDPELPNHLVDVEGPAVLAWLIQGARDYLAYGAPVPVAVRAATDAYRLDQDTVTRFVNEVCETGAVTDPLFRSKVSTVRSEYENWCHYEGEHALNPKVFTQQLRTKFGVYSNRSIGVRFYDGIRVKDSERAEHDPVRPNSPESDSDSPWYK